MAIERRSRLPVGEDDIVRFMNQLLIRLAAIAVACLVALSAHVAGRAVSGDRQPVSATHAAGIEQPR